MKYIVLAPFTWGKDESDEQALLNCINNLSGYTRGQDTKFVCFQVSDETYVDDFGGLVRPKGDPEPVGCWTRVVPYRFIEAYNDACSALIEGDERHEIETIYHEED